MTTIVDPGTALAPSPGQPVPAAPTRAPIGDSEPIAAVPPAESPPRSRTPQPALPPQQPARRSGPSHPAGAETAITIVLRPVPRTAPESVPWPAGMVHSGTGSGQPSLPWAADPVSSIDAVAEEVPTGNDRVRTVRFGDSWAGRPPAALPDPGPWSVRLAHALIETVQGLRPIAQLARWLDPPTLARVTDIARRRAVRDRPRLTAVHLHLLAPTTVEAVGVLTAPYARATVLAFRLEALGDRWLCTALETGPTSSRH